MSETISHMLLWQRVRNRIIDVLEIAASFESTARFGAFEVINLWEDWYSGPDSDFCAEPVFAAAEQGQIAQFSSVLNDAASVDEADIFDAAKLEALPHWRRFREAADSALRTFRQRGRFSEDEEQFQP